MANIFDKDTASTDNHLLNEQFHAFSKSPSSPSSTLGGASNRSGHTVSASDVWAEKIPAFFYPKADSDYAVCKANAKLNDICRWGDEIQIWDGEKFVKFADNYAAIPDGHEFLNEEGQPVVRFHKSRVAYNLNDTNNAYDNSLDASGKGASAKILGWDKTANDGAGAVYAYVESAPQFITQFVAPTDNIVKGVPSKGYGPIVMVGGSPLTEDADSTAGYIANNFAGIIQFNERKTQGSVTVHAFEYCGKTLGTTTGDIAELEDKLSKISVIAKGGLQGVSEDDTSTGLSTKWVKLVDGKEVDAQQTDDGAYPVLTVSTGSVDGTDNAKLVTGSAVKTYIDEAITTDGIIGKAISDVEDIISGVSQTVVDIQTTYATKSYVSDTISEATSKTAIVDNDASTKLVTAEQVSTYVASEVGAIDTGVTTISVNGGDAQKGAVSITALTDVAAASHTGINSASISISNEENKVKLSAVSAGAQVSENTLSYTTNYLATADDADVIATFRAEEAKDALADTAIKEQSVSGAGISVTLGGEVGAPTLTGSVTTASYDDGVWTNDDKVATGTTVAAAIKDVDDKINTLHSTAVTYKVFETKPVATEELKGIIALVPAGEGDSAVAGSYIEWLCVESVAEDGTKSYSWERIGTTAADFTQYAKTADLKVEETTANGLTYSQTNGLVSVSVAKASTTKEGTVQLTASYDATEEDKAATGAAIAAAIATLDTTAPVGEGAVKVSQTDGIVSSVTVETEALVSEDAIKESIASDTALVTAKSALEAIKLAKPDDYIATVKDGKGTTTTGQVAALTIKDDRENVYENDLWGTSVTLDGNVLTVSHNKLSNPKASNHTAAWGGGITKVEDNKAYNGETVVANIQTEMIKDGSYMFYAKNLSEFSSDLSSLTVGYEMFDGCDELTSFTSDISRLTNGDNMFANCHKLKSFSSNLSRLTNGNSMFFGCKELASFSSDLSSLTESDSMFGNCNVLTSFCGDLSSLTESDSMFLGCSLLTSFCGDLSSLKTGATMFSGTKLDTESVECIADVIKSWGVYGEDGSLTGTSDEKVHQITIDVADTASTEIAKYLEEIAYKGWTVATNHTAFAATSAIDGDKPAATFMIARPATEANVTYVDAAGNFFTIETAVSVIGIGQSEWSIFASIEDAIAEWELTPYTKA